MIVVTHEHEIAAFASRLLTLSRWRLIGDSPNAPRDAAALLAVQNGRPEPIVA